MDGGAKHLVSFNQDNSSTCLVGLLRALNEFMFVKQLETCLPFSGI